MGVAFGRFFGQLCTLVFFDKKADQAKYAQHTHQAGNDKNGKHKTHAAWGHNGYASFKNEYGWGKGPF